MRDPRGLPVRGLDRSERRVLEALIDEASGAFEELTESPYYDRAIYRLLAQQRLARKRCGNCGQAHLLGVTPAGRKALEITRSLANLSNVSAGWS